MLPQNLTMNQQKNIIHPLNLTMNHQRNIIHPLNLTMNHQKNIMHPQNLTMNHPRNIMHPQNLTMKHQRNIMNHNISQQMLIINQNHIMGNQKAMKILHITDPNCVDISTWSEVKYKKVEK